MSAENAALLTRTFESFAETGQFDFGVIDPEIEMINFDSFPVTRPYHGHQGVAEWLTDVGEPFDDFRFELVEVLAAEGDRVVGSHRASGASRTGGPTFELEWAAVYTFRDGKAIRVEGFRSAEEALAALA